MAVDDLPFPVNPTVDLCGIPASQHAFRSIRQFSIIDKVERQEGDIAVALKLRLHLFVAWSTSANAKCSTSQRRQTGVICTATGFVAFANASAIDWQ
jgi:hypothetical protein